MGAHLHRKRIVHTLPFCLFWNPLPPFPQYAYSAEIIMAIAPSPHSPPILRWLAVGGLLWGAASRLDAHEPGFSTLHLTTVHDQVSVEFEMSSQDVALLVPAADQTMDGYIDAAEFNQNRARLTQGLSDWINLNIPEPAPVTVLTLDYSNGDLLWRGIVSSAPVGPWQLTASHLAKLPASHRLLASATDATGTLFTESLLSRAEPDLVIAWSGSPHLVEDNALTADAGNRFFLFAKLGVEHILIGYDHLLFLAGLLIATQTLRAALIIITSFTLAHSITLGLSALNLVHFPGSWVEPLIAASIVYVGLENLWRRDTEPRGRWLLTFAFGLVHGFGFASVLREIGLGAQGSDIIVPLLGFNLGVEAGQFAIAAFAVPLLARARRSERFANRGVPVLSAFIALMGFYWLIERTLL